MFVGGFFFFGGMRENIGQRASQRLVLFHFFDVAQVNVQCSDGNLNFTDGNAQLTDEQQQGCTENPDGNSLITNVNDEHGHHT
jgi:hypothetical protein